MKNAPVGEDRIARLIDVSEENLYIGLGKLLFVEEALKAEIPEADVLIEGTIELQPKSILYYIEYAKQFLDDNQTMLFDAICIKWDFCEKKNDPEFSDNITIVTSLIDIIATVLFHSPLVITTVAVILTKKGLSSFCNCPKSVP